MRSKMSLAVRAAVVATALLPVMASAQTTSWVRGGLAGRLVYGMDDAGDRIGDFSRAGYMGGGVPLPDAATLGVPIIDVPAAANNGDSLAAIQAAINTAAAMTKQANGYRAVVRLSAAQYRISDTINFTGTTSGVILRGAGDSATTGTRLVYTGTEQIPMILLQGTSSTGQPTPRRIVANSTSNVRFDAKVIPSGSYALPLDDTTKYKVGDKILITRPSPANWIHDIKMDQIPERDGTVQWAAGSKDQLYERVVTAIDKKNGSVMLDTPLPNALQAKYGGATVAKYTFDRVSNIGIENIYGNGRERAMVGTNGTDTANEEHARGFIQIGNAENVFVRNVTSARVWFSAVNANGGSKYVTVDDAAFTEPLSTLDGSRRYAFNMEGQYSLMSNVRSDLARHDFVNNNPARGPNVFLDPVATNSNTESGPHQRWSTGTLFDNLNYSGREGLSIRDRGNSGSGHGWTGSGMVVWNSRANEFDVQSPPTSQNWIVGSTGPYASTANPGYSASRNAPVTLGVNGQSYTSLYRAQLADRLARTGETVREYTVGDYDGYTPGDAADAPPVDAAWRTAVQATRTDLTLTGLDDRTTNPNKTAFTFDYDLNPAVEHVSSAVLTIGMSGLTNSNPAIGTIYADTLGTSMRLDSLLTSGNAFSTRFTTETGVATDIFTIEFLPTDLLAAGNIFDLAKLQDGRLNLALLPRYGVDWANLVITVAPGAVPEPACLGMVFVAATALLRRRR